MTYVVDLEAVKAQLLANQPAGIDLLELAELHDKLEDQPHDYALLRPRGESLAAVRQRLKDKLISPAIIEAVAAVYERLGLVEVEPEPAAPTGPRSRLSPLAERALAS